ncbi:MAG: hypothetical protein QG628_911 [Patescibacteria group bacterium]|jgi:hypothetical protein|nr:hypothetical protein [Patescibacteria group bacterium]
MRQITSKIKPAAGFSHFIHIALTCLLPAVLFIFVRTGFVQIAAAIILLSKWRMFAVKPRHWPANIRANAVDIIVGLSALIFMAHTDSASFQLLWAVSYGVWLLAVKPLATTFGVSLQALISQALGLTALFIAWGDAPVFALVIGAWIISYNTARHFFASFEEGLARYLSGVWAYFSAAMVWILSHWLIFYGPIAQPALLLSVLSFGLGGMYYLQKSDRMSVMLRRQIVFVMVAIVVIVLAFSQWGDKTI